MSIMRVNKYEVKPVDNGWLIVFFDEVNRPLKAKAAP